MSILKEKVAKIEAASAAQNDAMQKLFADMRAAELEFVAEENRSEFDQTIATLARQGVNHP